MKIDDVLILNWYAPGEKFWAEKESTPDEPMIVAQIQMTLSHTEYHKLLEMDERAKNQPECEIRYGS